MLISLSPCTPVRFDIVHKITPQLCEGIKRTSDFAIVRIEGRVIIYSGLASAWRQAVNIRESIQEVVYFI